MDVIKCSTDDGVDHYFLIPGVWHTRSEPQYSLETSHGDDLQPTGQPCTIKQVNKSTVCYQSHGPSLVVGPSQPQTFFQFIKKWRGEWMWSNIINEGHSLVWVIGALKNRMTVWVTDGSYIKEVAPLISWANWIVYSTVTKLKMYESFSKRSHFARS